MKNLKSYAVAMIVVLAVVGASHTASATNKSFKIKVDNSVFQGKRAVN